MADWTITGAAGEIVRGSSHAPEVEPEAAILFAHGFKGYKDYGFIPVLAAEVARRLPVVAHRFNFSHSGMGERIDTFERPELFERDTWNKQVEDIHAVAEAARSGALPETPARLPLILMGHSRGGVSCLLAAGREGSPLRPRAIVTLAAPAECCRMSDEERRETLERGFAVTSSARTGQELKIDAAWLREQEEDPESHDVLACCERIACPVLAIHGAEDPTVDPAAAGALAEACPLGEAMVVYEGNHVFNTPNPADPSAPLSEPLTHAADAVERFVREALS